MGTSHNPLGGNKGIIYSALVAGWQISSEEQFFFRIGLGISHVRSSLGLKPSHMPKVVRVECSLEIQSKCKLEGRVSPLPCAELSYLWPGRKGIKGGTWWELCLGWAEEFVWEQRSSQLCAGMGRTRAVPAELRLL